MASQTLSQVAREHFRASLRDPAYVATLLDEYQHASCAGLILFPQLSANCTAHLFASDEPIYLAVFKAVRSGSRNLLEVYEAISPKMPGCGYKLACIANYPGTVWSSSAAIERLKQLVSWQYRQERARQKVAA